MALWRGGQLSCLGGGVLWWLGLWGGMVGLMAGCTTMFSPYSTVQQSIMASGLDEPPWAPMWSRCSGDPRTPGGSQVSSSARSSLDGGGELRWQVPRGGDGLPLRLDWLAEKGRLSVEITDLVGSTVWSFTADDRRIVHQHISHAMKAQVSEVARYGFRGPQGASVEDSYSTLAIYGITTGFTPGEWGCLLSFGLPAQWLEKPGEIVRGLGGRREAGSGLLEEEGKGGKKTGSKVMLRSQGRRIKITQKATAAGSPKLCISVRWRRYGGLISPRARVCYQGPYLQLGAGALSQSPPPQLKWSYRSSDGWSLTWRPQ